MNPCLFGVLSYLITSNYLQHALSIVSQIWNHFKASVHCLNQHMTHKFHFLISMESKQGYTLSVLYN
jgi:hypothetical protein